MRIRVSTDSTSAENDQMKALGGHKRFDNANNPSTVIEFKNGNCFRSVLVIIGVAVDQAVHLSALPQGVPQQSIDKRDLVALSQALEGQEDRHMKRGGEPSSEPTTKSPYRTLILCHMNFATPSQSAFIKQVLLPFTTDQYQQEERRKKKGIGRDVTAGDSKLEKDRNLLLIANRTLAGEYRATICTRIPFDVVALPGARADRGTDAANGAGEEVQQQTYGNVETNLVVLRDGPLAEIWQCRQHHTSSSRSSRRSSRKAGHQSLGSAWCVGAQPCEFSGTSQSFSFLGLIVAFDENTRVDGLNDVGGHKRFDNANNPSTVIEFKNGNCFRSVLVIIGVAVDQAVHLSALPQGVPQQSIDKRDLVALSQALEGQEDRHMKRGGEPSSEPTTKSPYRTLILCHMNFACSRFPILKKTSHAFSISVYQAGRDVTAGDSKLEKDRNLLLIANRTLAGEYRATICTRIPFDVVALPGARADRGTDAANGAGEEVQQQTYGNVETNLVVLRDGPLAEIWQCRQHHTSSSRSSRRSSRKAGHPISRLCMVCRGTTVRVQRYFALLMRIRVSTDSTSAENDQMKALGGHKRFDNANNPSTVIEFKNGNCFRSVLVIIGVAVDQAVHLSALPQGVPQQSIDKRDLVALSQALEGQEE
eukprot:gene12308-8449_t